MASRSNGIDLRRIAVAGVIAVSGCVGTFDDPIGGAGGGAPLPEVFAVSGLRRLTQNEYDNTLGDLIGDTTRPGSSVLPSERPNPFDNDYTNQVASQALIDGVDILAADAIARLLADPARLATVVGCTPAGPDDQQCFRHFVTTFGRRALRRALSDEDIAGYMALQKYAVEDGDFYSGVDPVLRAMLQDPRFLYRVEVGTPVADHPGVFRLDDWEVATRLSYFLWGNGPDDALLDLASAGQLRTPDQVRQAAEKMLLDRRALSRIDRFHALWMGYDRLSGDPTLTKGMRNETGALIDRVIFQEKRPWQDLFRFQETFIDDTLADHYGLPRPNSAVPVWTPYGDSGRAGILSHGSFLSNGHKFDDTSPTVRGKVIRTLLFCQDIPPPPPNVDVNKPPPTVGTVECKVDRYKSHTVGSCYNCHKYMDPVGFGLENYDATGAYRTTDPGKPECVIEGQGELVGIGKFHGPGELSALLVQSGVLNSCLTTQLYRFAGGRYALDDTDATLIQELVDKIGSGDFRFDQLLLSLVGSPAFGYRQLEQ